MARRHTELKTDTTGQYFRQLGWKPGLKSQPKFRLGKDKALAQVAYHKLGLLWDVVDSEDQSRPEASIDKTAFVKLQRRAVWTDESHILAEAIRKHQHTVAVADPPQAWGGAAYVLYLDDLRKRFGHIIQIEPANEQAAAYGRAQIAHDAEVMGRKARDRARIAGVPLPPGAVGQTLHQALDAYAKQVLETNLKESGKVEAAAALRLKDSLADMDLSEFGAAALERIRNYWAARPAAKMRGGRSTGRAISLHTVERQIKTARRFIRWLGRSDAFDWKMPEYGIESLQIKLQRLETDDEIAAKRHGVSVFKIEHLTTIYQYASDLERLLVLLGLNAAMSHAEIITLRGGEIEGDTIKRVRRKSNVYGEFALWPETQAGLAWWGRVRPDSGVLLMVTAAGNAYDRQRIANTWAGLRDRIERETGTAPAWWLPFKHLRKTAAQLVRRQSDGEVAGVFLSHGQPVASDDLADVYSNRPFDKVATALQQVRKQLKPMFAAAPTAFTTTKVGRHAPVATVESDGEKQ